jgi:hypothetical protein
MSRNLRVNVVEEGDGPGGGGAKTTLLQETSRFHRCGRLQRDLWARPRCRRFAQAACSCSSRDRESDVADGLGRQRWTRSPRALNRMVLVANHRECGGECTDPCNPRAAGVVPGATAGHSGGHIRLILATHSDELGLGAYLHAICRLVPLSLHLLPFSSFNHERLSIDHQ